jgi:hypothetical protein
MKAEIMPTATEFTFLEAVFQMLKLTMINIFILKAIYTLESKIPVQHNDPCGIL